MKVDQWIRESNLIENVDDPLEDQRCQRAWKWLAGQDWCIDTILMLHRKIMWKHNRKIAGKLRTCGVRVGSDVKMDWKKVPEQLDKWIEIYKNPKTAEEVRQAHIDFEQIHPHIDGNGRTGRMLLSWQRRWLGLEPLLIKASERWEYYMWFKSEDNYYDADRYIATFIQEKQFPHKAS